jgi:FemAB-related protein (PEP-CTERM system-associated)
MISTRQALAPVSVREGTDPASWDRFVEAEPEGTVEHLFGWRDIFRDVFHQQPVYLAASRGAAVVGVLPLVRVHSLLLGKSIVSLPYTSYGGIVTSDPEAASALVASARDLARQFGAPRVELRNSSRHVPGAACREHKVGARLPLPGTVDQLWAALDRKVRNQIRKPQKEGLVAQQGGHELLDEFYTVFAENMRDLGTPVFPKELFSRALLAFPDASVFVVRKDGVAAAASITLGWRKRLLVPWASALKRYRHLSPNMLLYWTMLEAAVSTGYETFDFGRSTRGGGTHQFKLQWSAQDFPLYWESVPVGQAHAAASAQASSSGLDMFVGLWQHLPLGIANVVGPHVIRHIV